VRGKREDKMLSELFRRKLENAEVTPSPAVSTNLMRRLGRREFLHFNPPDLISGMQEASLLPVLL